MTIDPARLKKFTTDLEVVMLTFAREFSFWGVSAERCRFSVVAGEDHYCRTACIDPRGHIIFNLDFYEKLTRPQFLFLVAHEICHFIFEHADRKGGREHLLWNGATDFAINLMLKYQFDRSEYLIKDICLDEKYDGMNAERIYDELMKDGADGKGKGPKVWIVDLVEGDGSGEGSGEGPGEDDVVIVRDRRVPLPEKPNNKNGKSAEQYKQEMKDYVRNAICEAYATAKNQGHMPAGMERAIMGHLKAKVNWLQALRQRLRFGASRKQPRDTTWNIPNRRFLSSSFVFPSTIGPESPKIAFAIDTSGSMSETDLEQAIGELEDIRRKFQARVYFLDCDADLYQSRWISPYQPLPKLNGGGGTDFAPVFSHLLDKRIKPDYCVFFTDGYGNFGSDPTNEFKVLWVLTNQEVTPPFGDVVRVAVDNES